VIRVLIAARSEIMGARLEALLAVDPALIIVGR
jgi:hypothetical protein